MMVRCLRNRVLHAAVVLGFLAAGCHSDSVASDAALLSSRGLDARARNEIARHIYYRHKPEDVVQELSRRYAEQRQPERRLLVLEAMMAFAHAWNAYVAIGPFAEAGRDAIGDSNAQIAVAGARVLWWCGTPEDRVLLFGRLRTAKDPDLVARLWAVAGEWASTDEIRATLGQTRPGDGDPSGLALWRASISGALRALRLAHGGCVARTSVSEKRFASHDRDGTHGGVAETDLQSARESQRACEQVIADLSPRLVALALADPTLTEEVVRTVACTKGAGVQSLLREARERLKGQHRARVPIEAALIAFAQDASDLRKTHIDQLRGMVRGYTEGEDWWEGLLHQSRWLAFACDQGRDEALLREVLKAIGPLRTRDKAEVLAVMAKEFYSDSADAFLRMAASVFGTDLERMGRLYAPLRSRLAFLRSQTAGASPPTGSDGAVTCDAPKAVD